MKRNALDRLVELRRRREEKALEQLAIRQGVHSRAKTRAEEAQSAVIHHAAAAKERERELMGSLLGQSIKPAAITRLQVNLDVLAHELQALKGSEETARKELREHRRALDKARQDYRERHRDTEKLRELLKEENKKTARRRNVIAETIQEEEGGPAPRRS
jgi:hypothetical protein